MALSQDAVRRHEYGETNELPVAASAKIFEGAAVSVNASGYARPLNVADKFGGFADKPVDNTDGSAGDKTVRLLQKGKIELPVTGVGLDDFRAPVYATADDTFTLNPAAALFIGTVYRFVSSGIAIVSYDAMREPVEVEES